MPKKSNYKEPKLKPQHKIVIEEIAKGKSQTDAYLTAYPNVKSRKVAQVNASQLLSKPIILQAVQNRIQRAFKHARVKPEELVGAAAFQMRSSIDDVIDESGVPDLQKARETGAIDLIKEIETRVHVDSHTGDKEYTYKIKMMTSEDGRKEVTNLMKAGHGGDQLSEEEFAARVFSALVVLDKFSIEDAFEAMMLKFQLSREQIEPFIDAELLEGAENDSTNSET